MTRSELYDFIANATQDQYTTDMIITAVGAYSSASNGSKPDDSGVVFLDVETATEPIQNALYATGEFTTDDSNLLADDILEYINDAGYNIIKRQ